jgi:hypothetical protein
MAIVIKRSKELAQIHGVKCLVYGNAGMGKTRLCATAPNPIIISAESGLLSLNRDDLPDLPVIEVGALYELNEAYQWATESEEAKQYDTICLDSISEIAEVILSNAKKTNKDPRQAYGDLIEHMMVTIKSFRDLRGKHVYMSCKQQMIKDDNGNSQYWPLLPGSKLYQELPYLFDEVFCARKGVDQEGKPFYYIQTSADIQYTGKDRSGKLDFMEYPDLSHIFNKILNPVTQEVPANGAA